MADPKNQLSGQQKRELLAQLLQKGKSDRSSNLSLAQRGLWFLQQVNPTVTNNVFLSADVSGPVDVQVLNRSLAEVVRRHEALRTVYLDVEGKPLRVASPNLNVSVTLEDVSHLDAGDQGAEIRRLALRDSSQSFDLKTGPLFRVTLVKRSETQHVLLVTMHQIVADGWSLGIFMKELAASYDALSQNRPFAAAMPSRQHSDFVLWERDWLQGDQYQAQLRFWKEQLTNLPPLDLPLDHPRTPSSSYRSGSRFCELPSDLVAQLEALSRRANTSLFVTLMAAYQLLLSRYSAQEDVVVGSPVRDQAWEGMIGPCVNAVVLRTDLAGEPTFTELLGRVAKVCEAAFANQSVPLERVADEVQVQREAGYTPLFQVGFEMLDVPTNAAVYPTLSWTPSEIETGTTLIDLALTVTHTPGGLKVALHYNAELFEPNTADRMLSHLRTLLTSIAADPARPVTELSFVTETEKQQLIYDWNNTDTDFPRDLCAHEMVEAQVEQSPDCIAVVYEDQHLTYRELNARANQVAHYLRSLGIGPDMTVGICVERSLELVVGLLGIWKAGAAYVPLDPEYPADRLRYVLEDSSSTVLLTQERLLDRLPVTGQEIVCLDSDWPVIAQSSTENPVRNILPDHLAYVLYTSGSTGRPKGAMISHRSVVNNLAWHQNWCRLTTQDRALQTYSYCFDPSVWNIFWPLVGGAQVIMIRQGYHYDSATLISLMVEHQVTVYGGAPTLHNILAEDPNFASCKHLRCIISGGEIVTGEMQSRFFEKVSANLYNAYGPTEGTIEATQGLCERVDKPQTASIGGPIDNVQVYLLDGRLQPVPVGVPGELYIAGVGLARGYHNRPDLTADKFIPNPFSLEPGARMYRSGDLARWRADGTIEFLGRVDDQVKVRGYRIELGEIAAALRDLEAVRTAVVLAREDNPGDKRLVAYVVPREGATPSRDELISALQERLPDYMVPRVYVFLDELPLNTSGKLDRKALPAPDAVRVERDSALVAPRTPLEAELAETAKTIFSAAQFGVEDSFFELGGSSLQMARLAIRVSGMYGLSIPFDKLFKKPTIAGMAEVISAYQREGIDGIKAEWTADQIAAEAALDPTITPEGLPHANYLTPEHVLLTGATGYLGAFLLEALLRDTTATVHCLVRASNREHGMERIAETLKQYWIWDDSFKDRIVPVAGDLGKPLLGLSQAEFYALAAKIDAIYHNGALVNFTYPYSALKAPNVQGTQEVLRLACTVKLKAVHHVSTIDVFFATHAPRPFVEISVDDIKGEVKRLEGYPLSKWIAEKIVTLGRQRGIPTTIFRPGLMVGHTKTGACHTTDYLLVMLKGFIDLGILPENPRQDLNMTPVDYAAKALVHLAHKQDSLGKTFHLWNTQWFGYHESYEWVRSFGYPVETASYRETHTRILQVDQSHCLYPLIPLFFRRSPDEVEHLADQYYPPVDELFDTRLEVSNMLKGIQGSGIEIPPMDERIAHLGFSYLVKQGFFPEPTGKRQTADLTNSL